MGRVRISIFRRLVDVLRRGDIITLSCQEHTLTEGMGFPFLLCEKFGKTPPMSNVSPLEILIRRFLLAESESKASMWRIRNTQILDEVYLISPSSIFSSQDEEDKILVHLNGRLIE